MANNGNSSSKTQPPYAPSPNHQNFLQNNGVGMTPQPQFCSGNHQSQSLLPPFMQPLLMNAAPFMNAANHNHFPLQNNQMHLPQMGMPGHQQGQPFVGGLGPQNSGGNPNYSNSMYPVQGLGKLELVFGRLSLASSGNQLCATEKLMAKKSEEECQIMIQKSFRTPMVRFLRERLEKAGCIVEDNFFKAITCNREVAGSYVRGEGIKVCSNYVRIQDDVNQVVIRELIHAFDDCRAANLDWSDCAHHACTEIRTNHLSGDCHYKRELLRGFLKLRGHEQECVRRKVLKSLSANPNCSGLAAEDSLEAVWDVCYNDTLPFDRAP